MAPIALASLGPRPAIRSRCQCVVPVGQRRRVDKHVIPGKLEWCHNSNIERRVVVAAAAEGSEGGPEGEPEEQHEPGFLRQRWITFLGIFFGYASFYITRNSLNAVNPVLLEDPALGFDKSQIGGLTSVMPVAYGFSKGLSGFAGSKVAPRVLLCGGLMATALVNIGFGLSSSYALFLTFWGMNGLLQGLGAPACARMLTAWFPSNIRGRFWALWTASNNIGGFMAPIIAGAAATALGWRFGMYVPGMIAASVAVLVFITMKDSPESAGFKPVDQQKKAGETKKPAKKDDRSLVEVIKTEVLSSPYIWLYAITYFFVYVIRQGVTTWFIFYLREVKGIMDAGQAAAMVSGLELGGLAGSLSSGFLSDMLIARDKAAGGKAGTVGLRTRLVMIYTAGTAVMILAFSQAPNVALLQSLLVAGVGFFLYGPQMLIGLCGAECVSQSGVGAAQGLLGWISYLGAASAGVPLAWVLKTQGWSMYFSALIGCCLVSLLLLSPMINLRSYQQRTADAEAQA